MSDFIIKNAVSVVDGRATMLINPTKPGDWHLVHTYSPEYNKLLNISKDLTQIINWLEITFQNGGTLVEDPMIPENEHLAYKIFNSDQKENFIKILKNLIK